MTELALALWIMVAPGAGWTWVTIGGPFDEERACETARDARLDRDQVLCVRAGS